MKELIENLHYNLGKKLSELKHWAHTGGLKENYVKEHDLLVDEIEQLIVTCFNYSKVYRDE